MTTPWLFLHPQMPSSCLPTWPFSVQWASQLRPSRKDPSLSCIPDSPPQTSSSCPHPKPPFAFTGPCQPMTLQWLLPRLGHGQIVVLRLFLPCSPSNPGLQYPLMGQNRTGVSEAILSLGFCSLSSSQGRASLPCSILLERTSRHQDFLAHLPMTWFSCPPGP